MTLNDHEQFCLDTATHFNAVRGRGSGRTLKRFDTLAEVQHYAQDFPNKRTMVYAINDRGNSAHIGNF